MTDRTDDHEGEELHGPTVRDRRRIDPETYQVREPQETAAPAAEAPGNPTASTVEVDELKLALAERTADLQRLQAEYVNYKRRVDRDRDLARKVAVETMVKDLLPVLDDIRSARDHDELTGGFKAVADEIDRITTKYGLESFGEKGDLIPPDNIRTPTRMNHDLTLFKNFQIHGDQKFQFRVGFFNLFNQAFANTNIGDDINLRLDTRCNVRALAPDGTGKMQNVCDPTQGFTFTPQTVDNFGKIKLKRGHRVIEFTFKYYF